MKQILEGKTALITGSSRGVGQQIAYALAQLGAKVILHARKRQNLKKTIQILDTLKAKYELIDGELNKKEDVMNLIQHVKAIDNKVDILINNAACQTAFRDNIFTHNWEDWEESFQSNVFAPYMLISGFVPGMIERGYGRIINLTSGIKHMPQLAPYGATKAAVDKLTDDIAVSLPVGVRMNTLDPGWLKTDMGGENAEHPVEAVLPGALVPVLIDDDGPNGKFFSAINYDAEIVSRYNLHQLKPA